MLPVLTAQKTDATERALHPLVMRLLNEFGDREDIPADRAAASRGFLLRYRSSSSPSLRSKILAAEEIQATALTWRCEPAHTCLGKSSVQTKSEAATNIAPNRGKGNHARKQ